MLWVSTWHLTQHSSCRRSRFCLSGMFLAICHPLWLAERHFILGTGSAYCWLTWGERYCLQVVGDTRLRWQPYAPPEARIQTVVVRFNKVPKSGQVRLQLRALQNAVAQHGNDTAKLLVPAPMFNLTGTQVPGGGARGRSCRGQDGGGSRERVMVGVRSGRRSAGNTAWWCCGGVCCRRADAHPCLAEVSPRALFPGRCCTVTPAPCSQRCRCRSLAAAPSRQCSTSPRESCTSKVCAGVHDVGASQGGGH